MAEKGNGGGKLSGIKDKVLDFIDILKSDKKKLAIVVIILIFCIVMIRGCAATVGNKDSGFQPNVTIDANTEDEEVEVVDSLYNQDLVNKQPDLIKKYGSLPEGYMWDYDGTVIALGNKELSAEETMYTYLNGIRTLDFSSAQRYSKESSVISRYNNFYSVQESRDASYEDNFYRNMYTMVLMSIQTHKVTNIATFANNKQVFTVELEVIDLSDKDFWKEDAEEIYRNLYIYEQDEDDDSKSEQYIYEYILSHYNSGDAKKKVITVNLTLEKDATLDTGWIVTIDKDIDNYCYYTDGVSVNKYIMNQYRDIGRESIREEELKAKTLQ